MTIPSNEIRFADLLKTAVTTPGILSQAYSQFHNYSLGNILLAAFQCSARGIPLGPMATFNRWRELGRWVKKGEKAITLCQPVTIRRKGENDAPEADDSVIVRFVYRNQWFVLAQTDGEVVPTSAPLPWERDRALSTLEVSEIPFTLPNGNVMGYARKREVAINPLNPLPLKTLFHEIGHILLGHTAETAQHDDEIPTSSLAEVEAECVALLCLEALGLPGAEYCRGYVQRWWQSGEPIPDRSAQRILRVADQILRAGRDDSKGVAQ